ncbi:hypothetical protein ACFX2I_023019 [Malus domestica]
MKLLVFESGPTVAVVAGEVDPEDQIPLKMRRFCKANKVVAAKSNKRKVEVAGAVNVEDAEKANNTGNVAASVSDGVNDVVSMPEFVGKVEPRMSS